MAQLSRNTTQRHQDLLALADRMVEGLVGCGPEQIILYGSLARGKADQYSDVDLLVVKETEQGYWERLAEVREFLPKGPPGESIGDVDLKVYTPAQFERAIRVGSPFLESVLGDGKVVYDKKSGVQPAAAAPRTKWSWDGGIRFARQPLRAARNWLRQADQNLDLVRSILEMGQWGFICFHSQQASELGLKAFLYLQGHAPVLSHSVEELVGRCAAEDSDFQVFSAQSTEIGKYYIETRYPTDNNGDPFDDDPLPPAMMFNETQAREAFDYAERIVNLVRSRISKVAEDSEGSPET